MSSLARFRQEKDRYFSLDQNSPLTSGQQERFKGLCYFEEVPELAFKVRASLVDGSSEIDIPLSTGGASSTRRWATVTFNVDGAEETLTVFREDEHGPLFLPFRDGTSGAETYVAGRYLEVHLMDDGDLWLDFNYAYNPFCAYNDDWSCPIPPPENRISSPIRAGERTYPDSEH